MMKKNTILKILSFVLVLTMVVAAVLLTGCGNKKEDPKASQAELDAAKAALEAAKAEIEKIQANIDKMTKDGSATADDLKKAQEELEAAQKALEELTEEAVKASSEEVYEALYGEDSELSIAAYEKKVKALAEAKASRAYIVDYDADDAQGKVLPTDAAGNVDEEAEGYDAKKANLDAYNASEVAKVEKTCTEWVTRRLRLASSVTVVERVWAEMEAAFAGIKKIVDKYDDELASLLPDANGGKLTLVKEDEDNNNNPIDQLETLTKYRNWIYQNDKLDFNGAVKEGTNQVIEPKKAEYLALVDAYAKLQQVYRANKYAYESLVTAYGEHEKDEQLYIQVAADGTETDKKANEKLGKFFTNFILYYEVTEKELVNGETVTVVHVYKTEQYNKYDQESQYPIYQYTADGTTKTLTIDRDNDGKVTAYKVNGTTVTAKAFKFADVFNAEANADAKYYVAVDVTKDLSANEIFFARKARYEQLVEARKEFATLYTKLNALRKLTDHYPLMSEVADIEGDLAALNAWQEKYGLLDAKTYEQDEIDEMELDTEALAKFVAANNAAKALNYVKNEVRKQIFSQIDGTKNAFGPDSYNRLVTITKLVAGLKEIKKDLVDPEVKGTTQSLTALLASWISGGKKDTDVLYAEYETYKDVYDRLYGYEQPQEDGTSKHIKSIKERITALGGYSATATDDNKVTVTDVVNSMIGQEGGLATKVYDIVGQAKTLDIVKTELQTLAETFRDGLTKTAKATDDLTGKETTVIVTDEAKGTTATLYWVVDFADNKTIEQYKADIKTIFTKSNRNLWPDDDETDTARKANYDLIFGEKTDAKDYLEKAEKTFTATKQAYVDAYNKVKAVIYTYDEEKHEMNVNDGTALQDLKSILWAKGIIDTLEKGKATDYFTKRVDGDANKPFVNGDFIVDSYKDKNDEDVTIDYGTFRLNLNKAVKSIKNIANDAQTAAAKIVKLITDDKLGTYTSLNQNPAVLKAIGKTTKNNNDEYETTANSFRAWCEKYLGVDVTKKDTEIDDDGNEKEVTKIVENEEFFKAVEKYFVEANEDGSNKGILGVDTAYPFISADNFKILRTVDVAAAEKKEAATSAFLGLNWEPEYAYLADVQAMNKAFVNYVITYYKDADNNKGFWEYYSKKSNISQAEDAVPGYWVYQLKADSTTEYEWVNALKGIDTEDKFNRDPNQTLISKLRGAETVEEKTIRFASYILEGGTNYYDAEGTFLGNDETGYQKLLAFNNLFYAVENPKATDPDAVGHAVYYFFNTYTTYDVIGVTLGNYDVNDAVAPAN